MSFVFVGVGFMGFVAATMLAIDVGVLMTARAQAQNAADAGAHAGAVALAFDDFNDRSSTGPAVTHAVARAQENPVMAEAPSVTPDDVEFFQNDIGLWNQVEVTVYRTANRGNALDLFIAPLFGIDTADVAAIARAEASPANAADCVLPFMIPDKWKEVTDPPFDSVNSKFEYYKDKTGGAPLDDPDVYYPPSDTVNYQGYHPERDKGTPIVLKTDNSSQPSPSIYQPIVIPGQGTGADEYREAIANCIHADYEIGNDMTVEPGNMVGPTKQGIDDLVAKDPDAYWDEANNCPARYGKCIAHSPRIRPIPLYDPHYYETGKQTGRNADFRVANIVGVFVDGMQGNEVVAHITPINGKMGDGNGPVPAGAFPYVIRIIR
jgi:hypothetical protein